MQIFGKCFFKDKMGCIPLFLKRPTASNRTFTLRNTGRQVEPGLGKRPVKVSALGLEPQL
jgi:hypothetical protein